MVSATIDWLTVSCMTSLDIGVCGLLNRVLETLRLSDIWDKFIQVGRDKYYESVYRYNDISILVCADNPKKLLKNGVCVRFSGNGLAFYQEHLSELGYDLRTVCRAWRALSVGGFFTRCSRFDYAIDDVCRVGDKPLLTMDRVRSSASKREFCSRLSRSRRVKGVSVVFDDTGTFDDSYGDTVYFGNRKSPVFCRFYDKLLESRQHRDELDPNLISWTRCEFEFKGLRALSVFNSFCDLSSAEGEFQQKMSEVFNHYLSFIYRDDLNSSRCTQKKWWTSFLGTSSKSRLVIPKYKPDVFRSISRWIDSSVMPTLANYIIKCIGVTAFLRNCFKYLRKRPSPRIQQMINDYDYIRRSDDPFSADSIADFRRLGIDPWIMTGAGSSAALEQDYVELVSVDDFSDFEFDVDCDWSDERCSVDSLLEDDLYDLV